MLSCWGWPCWAVPGSGHCRMYRGDLPPPPPFGMRDVLDHIANPVLHVHGEQGGHGVEGEKPWGACKVRT